MKSQLKNSIIKNLILLSFLLFGFVPVSNCQELIESTENVNKMVIDEVFSFYQPKAEKKRILLNVKESKLGTRLNPLTYLAAGSLFIYQNVISEQISANCNYEISCSEYTKRCIGKYGLIKGTFLGLHQLTCCTPNINKDYCDYKISSNGKIINTIE